MRGRGSAAGNHMGPPSKKKWIRPGLYLGKTYLNVNWILRCRLNTTGSKTSRSRFSESGQPLLLPVRICSCRYPLADRLQPIHAQPSAAWIEGA